MSIGKTETESVLINEGLKRIADWYGEENQLDQLVEELGELIQAVQKYKRYRHGSEELFAMISECADVRIMIDQILYLTKTEEIEESKCYWKILRQIGRIVEEQEQQEGREQEQIDEQKKRHCAADQ